MKCPKCGGLKSYVSNTRNRAGNTQIRRQRKCVDCGMIWYTIERDEFERKKVEK